LYLKLLKSQMMLMFLKKLKLLKNQLNQLTLKYLT
jgi:hypothetical protein